MTVVRMGRELEALREAAGWLRIHLSHTLHPPWSYCQVCDPAWIHGSCDRCENGRLRRDTNGNVKCSVCGSEYDLKMKIK